MAFEHIEKLKRDYTDKYVVVDASRPELARFRDATGLVKTVNMSGRALVEFDQWDNIGWYDIELDFLKVVPKPEPKPPEEKQAPAKKPPGEAAVAKAAPALKPTGKPSTADILAAARAKKDASGSAAPAAKAETGKKPSTAEILAAARGKASTPAPAKSKAEPAPVTPEEAAEPVAEAAPLVEPDVKPVKTSPAGPLPTTIAEKIAYCRTVDSKK